MLNYIFSFLLYLFCINSFQFFSQTNQINIEGKAQGTTYHISYFDSLNRNFKSDIDSILLDFDYSVSTYNPTSIISKINSNDKNVVLDAYFIACFIKAKEIWKNTNGTFDPTVYPLVNAWGFGSNKTKNVSKNIIDSILNFVGYSKIELQENKIIKKDTRISLDFNAFAQGYSVDVISDYLSKQNIFSFLVEIGGEVYAKGKKPTNEKWKVGIEQAFDNKESTNPNKAILELENLAIATSGNYRKFFIENGVKYVHHIDPKTGYPTKNNLLSASVISKQAITSDAYATGILVMGLRKAKRFLKKHSELMVYLIYSDKKGNYQTFISPSLKKLILK